MTSLKNIFNPPAANIHPYNGSKPFVLVDIDRDDPARGDTHGYVGLARRVAHQTGADFLYLDHEILEGMYPSIPDRNDRLKKLFEDRGYPDFLFSRCIDHRMKDHLNKHGTGLIIWSINEDLSRKFNLRSRSDLIVPHHLTPETLQFQGHRFAEEYQELPRPFIGINFINLYPDEIEGLTNHLSELQHAYKEATFFVCSCHRTRDDRYSAFLNGLKEKLADSGGRFPVIGFDYNFHATNYGLTGTWNPYIGMLDQSDHIIQAGDSLSMLSETLATGKTLYTTIDYTSLHEKKLVKKFKDLPRGTPLKTSSITPIDLTGALAEKIVKARKEQWAEVNSHGISAKIKKMLKSSPCSPYRTV